jgi:hypothetical protein
MISRIGETFPWKLRGGWGMGRTSARLLVVILLTTVGCEYYLLALSEAPMNGIDRSMDLSAAPNVHCIKRVLEAIPEIKITWEYPSISYDEAPRNVRREMQTLSYEWDDHRANLDVGKKLDGTITLSQYRLYKRVRPPSAGEIRETRRMMQLIEGRLATQCGIKETLTDVKEECYRVDCSK